MIEISIIILATAAILGYAIHRALSKWQPMETAPRDGSKFIILDKYGHEWLVTYREDLQDFVSCRMSLTAVKWREVTKFD